MWQVIINPSAGNGKAGKQIIIDINQTIEAVVSDIISELT